MSSTNRVLKNKGHVITSAFGNRSLGWHSGVDIVGTGSTTDDIIAHSDGTVVWVQHYNKNNPNTAGTNQSYGNCVKIQHSNGWCTLYAHMSRIDVTNGQKVKKGQTIGHMGNTGHSYGAHLHFEVRKGTDYSNCTNPAPYLNASLSGKTDAMAKGYLTLGDTGNAVKEMQKMLIACGYSVGSSGMDGSFGQATDSALRKFQKDKGLTVDGNYGPSTQTKLKEFYAAIQEYNKTEEPVKVPENSDLVLLTNYMTANGLYDENDLIDVKGIILHSVGCCVADAEDWWRRWNKSTYANALVNGFIDDEKAILAVPCMEKRGKSVRTYHVSNRTTHASYMGFEMCEYGGIDYKGGGSWDLADINEVGAYAKKTYANAVKLFARLCEFHNLDPQKDGVILSHHEAYERGMGSNHGDVEHIWKHIGLTMDQFRKDVAAAMGKEEIKVETKPVTNKVSYYRIRKSWKDASSQIGAFTSLENAKKAWKEGYFVFDENGKAVYPKVKQLTVNGVWDKTLTKRLQEIFGTEQDGIISNQWSCYKASNPGLTTGWDWKTKPNGKGSQLIRSMQKKAGMSTSECDGEIGATTIKRFQKYFGTTQDGCISKPSSLVMAIQKWANKQG